MAKTIYASEWVDDGAKAKWGSLEAVVRTEYDDVVRERDAAIAERDRLREAANRLLRAWDEGPWWKHAGEAIEELRSARPSDPS